jgi:hypothetical protein
MTSKFQIDEEPFKKYATAYVVRQVLKGIKPVVVEDICDWCEANIDLSFDHTSSAKGLVKLYPYQREILEACDNPSVQEVTIQAGQRLGKSQLWKFSMLKRVHDGGLSGLIVYPSLDLGERTNKDTVVPLLQTLPEATKDLAQRGNKLKSSFHLPSLSSVIYFLGGGSQVISSTANWVVLDESDFVELQQSDDEDKNMSQIKALRLRMQSFKQRMMIVCSSPSQFGGVVHQNWKRGSMGEWNLRCLHCGELSPVKQLAFYLDGNKWAGLQWRKNENGEVIEDSIRWICPHCQHEHTYADAPKMNELGQFIHQRPNNTLHRSYQIGALANPQLWTWREIAQAQEDAIDGDGKKYLANTILGIPYKHVADGDTSVSIEETNHRRQVDYPSDLANKIVLVVAGIDRQASEIANSKYYVSVVRGFCDNGDSYLLSCGIDQTLGDVESRISNTYYGHKVALALIDNGGFETAEYQPFVEAHSNLFWYKGTSSSKIDNKDWISSTNVKKLFLVNALGYQVKLLDRLYTTRRVDGNKWLLPINVDADYFQQLCNVAPARAMKDQNNFAFENWCSYGANRRDYFDCEKMILTACDIACSVLPAQVFPTGHKPAFFVKEQLMKLARRQKIGKA